MHGKLVPQLWKPDASVPTPRKHRRPCRFDAFVPDPLVGLEFSIDAGVAAVISEAENAIRDLNNAAHPALAPLARLLLRTESIASSRVEGMQIGVRDLARAEARVGIGERAGATAGEIVANIEAMEHAVHKAASVKRFSLSEIKEIHKRLMMQTPSFHVAGEIRRRQNWIGGNNYNPCGADFTPPPPRYVEDLLADLCDAVDDDSFSPLAQAAMIHAQFETIHPFEDGNGRTGRALVHVVLRRRGLAPTYIPPISVVLAAEKDDYIAGLTRYRKGDFGFWLERFAVAAARSARLASEYLEAVEEVMADWRERLRAGRRPRADAAAWAVIDVLPAHPIITAPAAEAATGRAKSSIHQAIADLEEVGILIPLSAGKRNQSWEAAGMLELLEDLESGEQERPRPP